MSFQKRRKGAPDRKSWAILTGAGSATAVEWCEIDSG